MGYSSLESRIVFVTSVFVADISGYLQISSIFEISEQIGGSAFLQALSCDSI